MMILFLLAFLLPCALPAQRLLDPDTCWSCKDSYWHASAGALLDVSMRAGYIASRWRRSAIKRVSLVLLVGAAYEGVETLSAWENKTIGQRGYGFGFKDLTCDLAGAVAVEVVVAIGKKLF